MFKPRKTGRFLAKTHPYTFPFRNRLDRVCLFTCEMLYSCIPVYTCSSFEPIMRKRHLELIWITRGLTSLDICALTMFQNFNYSNYNTELENKIMVRNEKLIL